MCGLQTRLETKEYPLTHNLLGTLPPKEWRSVAGGNPPRLIGPSEALTHFVAYEFNNVVEFLLFSIKKTST